MALGKLFVIYYFAKLHFIYTLSQHQIFACPYLSMCRLWQVVLPFHCHVEIQQTTKVFACIYK